jgi:hypothetical protein
MVASLLFGDDQGAQSGVAELENLQGTIVPVLAAVIVSIAYAWMFRRQRSC